MRLASKTVLLAAASLHLLGGCDSSRSPADVESIPSLLLIEDGALAVTLSPGDRRALGVLVLDQQRKRMEADLDLTWRADPAARVTVDDDGVIRAGEELGLGWVHATADGLRDSVAVWVQRREGEPSDFDITLYFSDRVPPLWREALERAADRWERVVRARLPEVAVAELPDACQYMTPPPPAFLEGTEDGVRLYVEVSDRFPPGTLVSAVGGPCRNRGLPHPTTVLGRIAVNRDRLLPQDLEYLTHHEMGHTLGLVGLVQGHQPDWLDGSDYRGPLGLHGVFLDTGVPETWVSFANGSHWPFRELMGTGRSLDIGHASVGALMDLGYPAAWYGVGPVSTAGGDGSD